MLQTTTFTRSSLKFVDLLFDTIIFEIATASRTNSTGPQPGESKHTLATFNGLAACFRIAEETCEGLDVQLRQAGLSHQDNVEKYVANLQRPDPIYMIRDLDDDDYDEDEDEDDPSKKWELVQSTQGLMVPIVGESDIDWFYEHYIKATPDHQDIIAQIIFKLRTTRWGVRVSTTIPGRVDLYCPQTAATLGKEDFEPIKPKPVKPLQAPKAPKENKEPRIPNETSVRAAFIAQKLEGLTLVTDRKTTFWLKGERALRVVEPAYGAHSAISSAMMVLYQVNLASPCRIELCLID